jgi:hypothetical protein
MNVIMSIILDRECRHPECSPAVILRAPRAVILSEAKDLLYVTTNEFMKADSSSLRSSE